MKKLYIIIVCILINLSISANEYTLCGIKTEKNEVNIYRGKSMQTIKNEEFLISMFAKKTTNGIQFSTSITNCSNQEVFFDENSITVYHGLYETDMWKPIDYEPATNFYLREKENIKASEFISAVSLGLSSVSAGYSSISGTGFVNGNKYDYTAKVYNSTDAIISMTNSYIALDNLQKQNKNYIDFLEENLLFSSVIPISEIYNGVFYVDEEKGPDYKVVINFSDENFIFYFSRSDKDEVLNPWKDKSYPRNSLIFGLSPKINHFSFYYLWSKPKGVGIYTGISYQNDGKLISNLLGDVYSGNDIAYPKSYELNELDPDLNDNIDYYGYEWKFDCANNDMMYDSLGWYLGLTIKIFPNSWVLTGCGIDYVLSDFYYGDLSFRRNHWNQTDTEYTYYTTGWISRSLPGCMFTPQIGINIITNYLDFGAMFYIPINGKFNFELCVGIAF